MLQFEQVLIFKIFEEYEFFSASTESINLSTPLKFYRSLKQKFNGRMNICSKHLNYQKNIFLYLEKV
jgi:hypothetical protein